jgi:hypothetical protein
MSFAVSQFSQLWRDVKGNDFTWAGHGEVCFEDGPVRFLIAARVGHDEFYAVWVPKYMSTPPGKFSLTHSDRNLRVHIFAPEGEVIRPGDLVVKLPGGQLVPWFRSLTYVLTRVGDKEIAVLEKLDGKMV